MRRLKEKQLLKEDETRGAADPTYKRRFRKVPEIKEDEMEEFIPYSYSPKGIPTPRPRPLSSSSSSSSATSSDSESEWSTDSESEWNAFASPYGDPYDFWHFDLPRPVRHADPKQPRRNQKQPPTRQRRESDRERDRKRRRR